MYGLNRALRLWDVGNNMDATFSFARYILAQTYLKLNRIDDAKQAFLKTADLAFEQEDSNLYVAARIGLFFIE